VCALVATRTDAELAGMLCSPSLADFDLSFFSSSTPPQFIGQLLAKVRRRPCCWAAGRAEPC
jgi:hypothetical protein